MIDEMDFTADQMDAVYAIDHWFKSNHKQTFSLSGLAGTGKSYLVSYLCQKYHDVAVCAPTGKAAHVLRCNGTDDACTLHSLIYHCKTVDRKPRFMKKPTLEHKLIICDEASMVGRKENGDLLSFNIPVLYVGDHGQLEPVGDNPCLMKEPDVKLEIIHRQALNNPILRMATAFREGRENQVWQSMREKGWWQDKDKRVTVTTKEHANLLIGPDTQIICGYNATRHRINAEQRAKKGYKELICPGEPLVCLHNRNDQGLFNGQVVTCIGIGKIGNGTSDIWIGAGEGNTVKVKCLNQQFGANTIADHNNMKVLLLDYAYALTAHKCQGSAFDDVLVMEEISPAWDARRWRYTCTTRARERIVYCV